MERQHKQHRHPNWVPEIVRFLAVAFTIDGTTADPDEALDLAWDFHVRSRQPVPRAA